MSSTHYCPLHIAVPAHLPSQPHPLTCPCHCVLQPLPLSLPPYTFDFTPASPTIPLPCPSHYPSPLPLPLSLPLPLPLSLSPTPPTIPLPCPSPLSVQESVALMQICQHSKFVHHVPDSIAPCFVPVMPSCQEMMQSSHCTMQSSPPEPLPLVYSLAPSTVAYFPPPPIVQQTDDRGYASAESSPLMQVSKSHDCHVIICYVIICHVIICHVIICHVIMSCDHSVMRPPMHSFRTDSCYSPVAHTRSSPFPALPPWSRPSGAETCSPVCWGRVHAQLIPCTCHPLLRPTCQSSGCGHSLLAMPTQADCDTSFVTTLTYDLPLAFPFWDCRYFFDDCFSVTY